MLCPPPRRSDGNGENGRLRAIARGLGARRCAGLLAPTLAGSGLAASAAAGAGASSTGAAGSGSPFPSVADAIGVVPTHDRDEAVRQLYEHGVCVLAAVLPAADLGALREAAVSTAKQHDQGVADPTWHVPGIFSIDPEWPTQRFVEHVAGPRVLAVLDDVFATAPGDYRVHSSTVQVNKPFCAQEQWHIDSWISQRGYCPAPHAHIRRTGYVNALWMLSVRSHSPPLSLRRPLCGGFCHPGSSSLCKLNRRRFRRIGRPPTAARGSSAEPTPWQRRSSHPCPSQTPRCGER